MPGAERPPDPIDAILARAMRASGAPPRPDCPDAQMLAAWFDKSLQGGAAARVESHLEECPRCQGIAAAMARAEADSAPAAVERSRWRVMFQMRFLAPAVAGAFALVALATAFHHRFGRNREAADLAAMQGRRAAAAGEQTRMLAKNEAAPSRMQLHQSAIARAPGAAGAEAESHHAMESGAQLKAQGARAANAPQTPAAANPIAVKSPDGAATWHIGAHGFISIYAIQNDHYLVGKQHSGVETDLLGGSAASAKVCWVVGRAGTILRTTDGGYRWIRVKSPTHADIAAVAAQSAAAATIRTTTGLQFSTADAGKTWKRK